MQRGVSTCSRASQCAVKCWQMGLLQVWEVKDPVPPSHFHPLPWPIRAATYYRASAQLNPPQQWYMPLSNYVFSSVHLCDTINAQAPFCDWRYLHIIRSLEFTGAVTSKDHMQFNSQGGQRLRHVGLRTHAVIWNDYILRVSMFRKLRKHQKTAVKWNMLRRRTHTYCAPTHCETANELPYKDFFPDICRFKYYII